MPKPKTLVKLPKTVGEYKAPAIALLAAAANATEAEIILNAIKQAAVRDQDFPLAAKLRDAQNAARQLAIRDEWHAAIKELGRLMQQHGVGSIKASLRPDATDAANATVKYELNPVTKRRES